MQPLPPQGQHLVRGGEETGVAAQVAERARIAVLRHAAQERRLAGQLQALLGGELDLLPVVEPALDDLLRRRVSRQRAERRDSERAGDVQVEQIGELPAGDLLCRQTPENVAEVAVGRELGACLAALRPKAFGQ